MALLIATYTGPGDLIANPARDHTITAVADSLDRRTTVRLTHRDHGGSALGSQTNARRTPGRAALIIDRPPQPHRPGLDTGRLVAWMSRRRDALGHRGFLLVAIDTETRAGEPFADRATPLITAARTVGLIYHQHLVVVHTPITEPASSPVSSGRLVDGRHARVHADIYAFTVGDIDD